MQASTVQLTSPVTHTFVQTGPGSFLNTKYYKLTREVQNNNIFNRAALEFLGADLSSAITELIGRNWKVAAEGIFRDVLYVLTSYFMPLLFIPLLNRLGAKKHGLPLSFNNLYYNQFEDLIPEKDTEEGNRDFFNKLTLLEGKEKVENYFKDGGDQIDKLKDFKQKLLKAKTFVMKTDILILGIVSYLVPWAQLLFSKKILGVVGFSGELGLLSEKEQEESTKFHEKTKYLKFPLGFISTIIGSNWYSNCVYKAATSLGQNIKENKFLSFIKKHIKQFDYYKQIYANKLNLAGAWLFGGDFGYLLTTRSLNEFIERCIKLVILWPTMFIVQEWLNSKLAEASDKKSGTQILDKTAPKEFGVTRVKTIDELEKGLLYAKEKKDELQVNRLTISIKKQVNFYWLSVLIDSLFMGVGLTLVNILGTKKRVERGIY